MEGTVCAVSYEVNGCSEHFPEVSINVSVDLCFYSHSRTDKEPCYYETYPYVHVIGTLGLSLYTFTAHMEHANSTMNGVCTIGSIQKSIFQKTK